MSKYTADLELQLIEDYIRETFGARRDQLPDINDEEFEFNVARFMLAISIHQRAASASASGVTHGAFLTHKEIRALLWRATVQKRADPTHSAARILDLCFPAAVGILISAYAPVRTAAATRYGLRVPPSRRIELMPEKNDAGISNGNHAAAAPAAERSSDFALPKAIPSPPLVHPLCRIDQQQLLRIQVKQFCGLGARGTDCSFLESVLRGASRARQHIMAVSSCESAAADSFTKVADVLTQCVTILDADTKASININTFFEWQNEIISFMQELEVVEDGNSNKVSRSQRDLQQLSNIFHENCERKKLNDFSCLISSIESDLTSFGFSVEAETLKATLQGMEDSNRMISLCPIVAESGDATFLFDSLFGLCAKRVGPQKSPMLISSLERIIEITKNISVIGVERSMPRMIQNNTSHVFIDRMSAETRRSTLLKNGCCSKMAEKLVKITVGWDRKPFLQLAETVSTGFQGLEAFEDKVEALNEKIHALEASSKFAITSQLAKYIPGYQKNDPLGLLDALILTSSSSRGGVSKVANAIRRQLKEWSSSKCNKRTLKLMRFSRSSIEKVPIDKNQSIIDLQIESSVAFNFSVDAQEAGISLLETVEELANQNSECGDIHEFGIKFTGFVERLEMVESDQEKCQYCKNFEDLKHVGNEFERTKQVSLIERIQDLTSYLLRKISTNCLPIMLCPSVLVASARARAARVPMSASRAAPTSAFLCPRVRSLATATDKQKLVVFDTTLRDGEQSPGVTLTTEEKLEIAKQLSRLGVDVCEAGFPIASPGDFDAVQRIAKEVGPIVANRKSGKPMRIAGLARAVESDIARCFDAVKHAPLHRIHTFLATSDIHLKYKLKISRADCIKRARAAVAFAKSIGCDDIEFSTEDAGRSERAFLTDVLAEVIAAGATTLNIPDTVGYNVPEEYGSMIKYLIENTEGGNKVTWSTHCHNDLGLATANSLSGIVNGARQVECTINGIGERAGNTSLEEVIMSLHTHPKYFPVYHDIDTTQIYMTSQLVTKKSGMVIQPNKAIVGANAFAHESGIHQDGVLKHKETYEIIQPQTIGLPSNSLVLGKLSGRNAFRQRIDQILGTNSMYAEKLAANPQAFELLFGSFKKLADVKKGGLSEQDLYALLDDQFNLQASGKETYRLNSVQIFSGNGVQSMATVSLSDLSRATFAEDGSVVDGAVERMDAATGEGAVHAIFRSINRLTGMRNVLASYEVKAVTQGSDSLGRVVVRVREGDSADDDGAAPKFSEGLETAAADGTKEVYQGTGTDNDVLIASAKAYINAINRLIATRQAMAAAEKQHPQTVVDKAEVKKEGAAAV
ncbi:hypothetical protein HDU83_000998 [Entophlyctis luteolus]|nr:hypothetical protein HDU83_000998 [Entophlyctis luteolus]